MRWFKAAVILIACLYSLQLKAQQGNDRCKWVKSFNEFITLDSLTIMPGTVSISSLDSEAYSVEHNLSAGTLLLRLEPDNDSLQVCYKVLPVSFHQRYYNRSLDLYDSFAIFKDPLTSGESFINRNELFAIDGLTKSGSISRGVSFGSNQDVFVNSTLNLNIDGKLTDDLNIRAAITDQNVPFQPEGNTQQVQDFDNVFIEVYNDDISVTGGDVVLQDRSSHYLNYYKNVQGGLARVNYSVAGSDSASTAIGVSVAKGRFASVQLNAREGLLGPYQIPGPEGEQFVLILANSERVFLDGRQLQRGFNQDYVIDYNTAELTFTNSVLITQFSRIRVDYEYSDQDYNRTIAVGKHAHKVGRFSLNVSAYSEKDNRNKPLLVELSNQDKQLLSEIGDSLNLAVSPGADSVDFSVDQILYKKTDTLFQGQEYIIFKRSTNPDSAFYRVTFSNVGMGNGNYIQLTSTANGRVFQWVAPVGGEPQGNFAPVIDIPVPDKKQMVAIRGQYDLTDHEAVTIETAFSDQDVNLFSPINDEDDQGAATKIGILSRNRRLAFLPEYNVSLFTDFEWVDRDFRAIDRFRYIEFDRDWSFSPDEEAESVDDHIFNIGLELEKDAENKLAYQFSRRVREGQVDGYQQNAKLNKRLGNFKINTSLFYLNNDLSDVQSKWNRLFSDVSYINKYLVPGYRFNLDKNRVINKEADSVISSAMFYDEHVYYLKNAPQSDLDFTLEHAYRTDKAPLNGDLAEFTIANTTQLNVGKNFGNDRLDVLFTYREVDQVQADETEDIISGRLNWNAYMLDNHIRSDLTYAISNSQELRREFVFVKVPTGQGTHTWRDLNDDGVQELGEFFEAINPDERNYAKLFVPTNEFVTAFQTLFIYNVSLDAPRSWKTAGGIKSFLASFSNTTSWSADTKTTDSDLSARMLSFASNVASDDLISERNSLRTTLFYNRAHPTYGFEFTYLDTENRQLLVNGFESSVSESYDLNFRYNLNTTITLKLRTVKSDKSSSSDFLEGRNYLIESYRLNPQLAWQPSSSLRLSAQYNYIEKRNNLSIEATESAFFNEIVGEIRINKAVKSAFNAQLRYAQIDFKGEENTPVAYDLLNALNPGENLTWSLNWQQQILSGLQLNLSYNGRKSENTDVIHIGRVQVSALF